MIILSFFLISINIIDNETKQRKQSLTINDWNVYRFKIISKDPFQKSDIFLIYRTIFIPLCYNIKNNKSSNKGNENILMKVF